MERNAWSGWIGFAGWLMIIVGAVDMFEGIVAIIRQNYYVFTANQIILFNVKTWGWIMLIWAPCLGADRRRPVVRRELGAVGRDRGREPEHSSAARISGQFRVPVVVADRDRVDGGRAVRTDGAMA